MSKRGIRVSGKRFAFSPDASRSNWKLSARPGGWILAESSDGRRVRLASESARGKLSASVSGTLWHGELFEELSAAAGAGANDSDLTAQFPGKVRKLLVAMGAQVTEGQPLLLMEAMKMEFSVKAPFAGKVSKLLVAEGQQVSPGDRFLEISPAKPVQEKR